MAVVTSRPRRKKGEGSLPVNFAARWTEEDLEEIKRRAKSWDLPASEYVRRCALGLQHDESPIEEHVKKLEERVQALEERAETSW